VVNSIAGPLDVSELGFTLMHEHIAVRSPGLVENFPSVWDRRRDRKAAASCVMRPPVG
jgi:predicted metal-dependent phosphotriesterase family hydrolase